MAEAAPVQIKSLDDIPGYASQQDKPGMQIAPLTPKTGALAPIDVTGLTPAYDPSELAANLKTMIDAQTEQIKASSDALTKNTIIQQNDYTEQVKQQDNVIQSWEKLQRIGRNPFAPWFALVDPSTWNPQQQKIDIEKAQLRSQQSSLRSQAQININNQLPALKETEVKLAGLGFENQLKYLGAVKDVTQLTNAQIETRMKIAEYNLKLPQEARAQLEFAVKSMSGAQQRAELARANKGQGQFADFPGFLEDAIQRDEQQTLAADETKQNIKNQKFDLAEKSMKLLVAGVPFTDSVALVEDALANRKSTVNIRGVEVPTGLLITATEESRKASEGIASYALSQSQYGMNQRMQTLTTQNTALAKKDPRASDRVKDIARFGADPGVAAGDPVALQRFSQFLDIAKKDTDESIKRIASTAQSPEAKAAWTEFGETGQASAQGGQAVTIEALGNPGIANTSAFPKVWEALQAETARRVKQLNPPDLPKLGNSAQSAQQMMTYLLAHSSNKKINDIKAEIVQGGFGNEVIHKEVTAKYRADAMKNTIEGLSTSGPQATPFLNMVRQPTIYRNDDGTINTQELSFYLAQQSLLGGKKVDYLSALIDGLDLYSTQANSMTADPSMIAEDHMLLSGSYGGDPRRSVTSEFSSEMKLRAQQTRKILDDRLQQDLSGETQRRALLEFTPAGEVSNLDQASTQQFLESVPSATGIGTAADMKRIYGTELRFGGQQPAAPTKAGK